MPLLVAACLLFFACGAKAQSPFEPISIEAALAKAKEQHKIVLVQVAARDCDMCNQVANTAFEKIPLREQMSRECISVYLEPGQPTWQSVQRTYNTRDGGLTLFLDENGTLINRYNGTSSNMAIYISHITAARVMAGNGAAYRIMEKSYSDGLRSPAFLEKFLLARNNLGLEVDSMLNDYAVSLPPDSVKSRRVLSFIARLAPSLGSPADKVLRSNISLFNQVWLSLEQTERVSLNNSIIRKSKQLAVSTRDLNAAFRVASFAGSTHFDPEMAQKAYDQNMIDFFRETRDTLKYVAFAAEYYEKYLMSISVDSVKKADSLRQKILLAAAPVTTDGTSSRKSIIFSPSTQIYSNQLTVAAKTLYNFSKDSSQLSTALRWSQRALEFYENPGAADLQARILYFQGRVEEAITWEQRAIGLAKEKDYPEKELEAVLTRMKSRQRKID